MARYKKFAKTTYMNHSDRGRLNLAISCYKEMLDLHRDDEKYDKNGVMNDRYRKLLLKRVEDNRE